VSVSLGLGLFGFAHGGHELKALHQHIGDPVGTGSGPAVRSSLVLFREGTGPPAAKAIQGFLSEILAASEKTSKNTFQIYRWHIQYQFWQRVSRCVARPVTSVVLPESTSETLIDDLSEFLSEETAEFYLEHGIPYKRSYLFHGVPGSGKTSMIQALAGRFGRNLCYLSPTHPELSDDGLKSAIEKVPQNAIIVLEDVDALFGKGREKKIQQSPLTFSGLLNALDGVGNHDGVVFVLTTNFKDQLDDALIRDGRVDMRVHFDYCKPEQMQRLFDKFYPPKRSESSEREKESTDAADPEIAALEAKLAALKKSKAADAIGEDAVEIVVNGAAFRDALLVSLGDKQVTAAQLQSFFVMHRKCTAAEALADVGSIVKAIDQKKQEGDAQEITTGADKSAEATSAPGEAQATQPAAAKRQEEKVVHVHVHTSGGQS